jgi:hypothetical protein
MDSGHIALIILAGLVLLGGFSMLKLFRWLNKRYYRNMFRGHLREDYLKNNPDHVRDGNIICACGGERMVLRNLGPFRLEGSDVVREHVCYKCGNRFFFSASGSYLESIIQELRAEADYVEPAKVSVRA